MYIPAWILVVAALWFFGEEIWGLFLASVVLAGTATWWVVSRCFRLVAWVVSGVGAGVRLWMAGANVLMRGWRVYAGWAAGLLVFIPLGIFLLARAQHRVLMEYCGLAYIGAGLAIMLTAVSVARGRGVP